MLDGDSPTGPRLCQAMTPLRPTPFTSASPAAAAPTPPPPSAAATAASVAGPGHVAARLMKAVLLCTSLTAWVRNAPTTLSSTLPPHTTVHRRLPSTRLEQKRGSRVQAC
eukprot:GHUV01055563.1.p1 GENE.GHUV01055563.1~~GHUV01055563.1.p1  ORF type:complete len:110 (-),score=21.93 GHUV01055563.1:141-470(-)